MKCVYMSDLLIARFVFFHNNQTDQTVTLKKLCSCINWMLQLRSIMIHLTGTGLLIFGLLNIWMNDVNGQPTINTESQCGCVNIDHVSWEAQISGTQQMVEKILLKLESSEKNLIEIKMQNKLIESRLAELESNCEDTSISQPQGTSTATAPVSNTTPLKECPPQFKLFEGSCYLFVMNKMLWQNAEQYCQSITPDCHLATVDTMDVHLFLVQYYLNVTDTLSGESRHFFIGGHDPNSSNNWQWIATGEMIANFTYWYPGEPNGSNEHCIVTNVAYQDKKWHDYSCHTAVPFVCGMKL